MSAEIITTIVSVAGLFLAFAGAFAWLIVRMDSKFDAFETKIDKKFDVFEAKMDARFVRIEDRLAGVEHELTEVKIAVARLEGPQRQLIPVR